MARLHPAVLLLTLLGSASLVTATGAASASPSSSEGVRLAQSSAAQPSPTSPARQGAAPVQGIAPAERAAGAAPSGSTSSDSMSRTPPTPMPLTLPDEATAAEVKGEYGFGIFSLVLGGLLIATFVLGSLFFITRRSWSASR